MIEEVEPRCDICGEPEDHRIGWYEYDWNGETGNHKSCEERIIWVSKQREKEYTITKEREAYNDCKD